MGVLCWSLGAITPGQAHAQIDHDWQLSNSVQLGVDAWHIDHSSQHPVMREIMFLADAHTRWTFRELSPWFTLQSRLAFGPRDHLVLRTRANQGIGLQLDQLYYDHALSPSLGFRAGISDYRATWCREYDVDNPWVRESDPFCTDARVRQAMSSAPALQAYLNVDVEPYQVQGIVGLYRPQLFGYASREFGDKILLGHEVITKNHKKGLSLGVIDKATATEWRFSWSGLDQHLFDSDEVRPPDKRRAYSLVQRANTFHAGVAWQVAPSVRSRLTHMTSLLKARCQALNAPADEPCAKFRKDSTVLELSYQWRATDVVSLAISTYPVKQKGVYEWRHCNWSLGWRRDWPGGWFSAVQLTRSHNRVPYNNYYHPVYFDLPATGASAWGAGLRIGYKW
jgi:hypothetical protein